MIVKEKTFKQKYLCIHTWLGFMWQIEQTRNWRLLLAFDTY